MDPFNQSEHLRMSHRLATQMAEEVVQNICFVFAVQKQILPQLDAMIVDAERQFEITRQRIMETDKARERCTELIEEGQLRMADGKLPAHERHKSSGHVDDLRTQRARLHAELDDLRQKLPLREADLRRLQKERAQIAAVQISPDARELLAFWMSDLADHRRQQNGQ